MKLLCKPSKNYPYGNDPREDLVTREEWEELFKTFPASVRRTMANLAAHNWHIIYDIYRVGAIGPSEYNGFWLFEDGSRVDMSVEEQDSFFPVVDSSLRYSNGYVAAWIRDKHGNSGPARVRQRQIVIPEEG